MGKWDQGLGVIGVIGFAIVQALVSIIGIPLVFSSEPIKASDWLGFAGGILSSAMALVAAAIAWRAVQRQIEVQREANMLGILTREEDRQESESHALEVCITILMAAQKARHGPGLANYYRDLQRAGLETDLVAMRRSIQDQLDFKISPGLLHNVTITAVKLMKAVAAALSAGATADGAGGFISPPSITAEIKLAEDQVDEVIRAMFAKRQRIEDMLKRYRARIEVGLSQT